MMPSTKKLTLLLALVCFQMAMPSFAQKKDNVTLKGIITHVDNELELEDLSDMQYLIPSVAKKVFNVDDSGRFSLSFYLEQPCYFRLDGIMLHLAPGDNLYLSATDTIIYRGTGREKNEYLLNTPLPRAGSFLEGGRYIKPGVRETINNIFAKANKRREALAKIKNPYGDFKKLELARIETDILNSLLMIDDYREWKLRDKPDSLELFKKDYELLAKPYIKQYSEKIGLNPLYLQLAVYRDVVYDISENITAPGKKENPVIEDWDKAGKLISTILLAQSKKDLYALQDSVKNIKTKRYRQVVSENLKEALKFGKGDVAIDFTMRNLQNEEVALSAFKGKVIYVDLWATWCGPCIEELPYLDTLKEKYRNNEKVAFISLSIDEESTKQRWLGKLKGKADLSNQFITNRIRLKPYSIVSIPRAILIDKDFKVSAMYADPPSSKNTAVAIDALLLNSN